MTIQRKRTGSLITHAKFLLAFPRCSEKEKKKKTVEVGTAWFGRKGEESDFRERGAGLLAVPMRTAAIATKRGREDLPVPEQKEKFFDQEGEKKGIENIASVRGDSQLETRRHPGMGRERGLAYPSPERSFVARHERERRGERGPM